jgi:hypothetical protein
VKPLAILLVTLALVTATAEATLAHIDTLGAPDLHWQHFPGASTASGPQVSADATSPGRASPLEVFVYAMGALFVLLLISLLRSLWTGRRRSRA